MNVLVWTNLLLYFPRDSYFLFSVLFIYSIPLYGYLLGFAATFSVSQFEYGAAEYALMFFLQVLLVPVFALMEGYGVWLALTDWKTYRQFYVVRKEAAAPTTVAQEPTPPTADTGGPVPDGSVSDDELSLNCMNENEWSDWMNEWEMARPGRTLPAACSASWSTYMVQDFKI